MDVVELPEGIAVCKFSLLSANRARVSAKRVVPRENPLERGPREKWSRIASQKMNFFSYFSILFFFFHAASFVSCLFKNIKFNFLWNITKDINSGLLFPIYSYKWSFILFYNNIYPCYIYKYILFYYSFKLNGAWGIKSLILLISIAAFINYVLPWGPISYWGVHNC